MWVVGELEGGRASRSVRGVCVCVCEALSCVQLFVILWTVAHQSPLSVEFSRQYWSGLPCPPPGDLPDMDGIHGSH